MPQRALFSVYYNLLTRGQSLDSPLGDLFPDDSEHGWHVARNLIEPLNHLGFLRRKEDIAVALNLHHAHTPPLWFHANYDVLARHQARKLSTADVIGHLAGQLFLAGKSLSEPAIAGMLREYASICHMEFHPSDACNLACCNCTYGHDDPARKPPPTNFPFQEIRKIAQMRPGSMVIVGGGEPALYKSGSNRFQEMIEEIDRANPGIALALVTNGTHRTPGDWPNRLSWIKISLDAATEDTYSAFRGKLLFHRVLQNFLTYLDYDVKQVGISFVFARSNIHDYAAVARLIFELVKAEKPQALHKVNIQYRPLRGDPCRYAEPFTQAVTEEQIGRVVGQVRELAELSHEMKAFLRDQTNIYTFEQGLKGSLRPSTSPEVVADLMY
jgi:pyruvate-formate lyase-activating enzyme